MNDAIGREDARARQWSAANASIEGNESVMERNDIKSSSYNRQVQDQQDKSWTGSLGRALWVWKCERLRCGGVMPRGQPLLARARGGEGHNTQRVEVTFTVPLSCLSVK